MADCRASLWTMVQTGCYFDSSLDNKPADRLAKFPPTRQTLIQQHTMATNLDGQLVVAISSRALFDLEEENRVFEQSDDRAYMKLQLDRLETPAKPGVAFSLVKKLLAFNTQPNNEVKRVEVVMLSRNDPVSGLRIFRSAEQNKLQLGRGVFTRGRAPYHYLKALQANLFL